MQRITTLRPLALLVAIACGGTPGGEPTDAADPPSPYVVDAPPVDEPTVSVGEIERALQAGLDLTLDVTAAPVRSAYDAAMTDRTSACPYEYVTPDGTYWFDSCTCESGAEFDGYVFALGESGVLDPYSGMILDYWYAFGGATVTTDEGDGLEISGGAVMYEGHGDTGTTGFDYYYSEVKGTFRWDGPEAAGTWLELGLDPDLVFQSQAYPDYGAVLLVLDGGLAGFEGGWAVAYDDNTLGGPIVGLSCEEEPTGTLGVRAPDGTWYDLRFDSVVMGDEAAPEAEKCDGCAAAFFQGERVGEVCADFSGLLDRAVRPW